ncbi:ROK family protein [Thiohalocapsa marina]|uniref:ROK family protein n=1 Tax=Thiohalocapsa marina TaxID=424902 RepID=A0A5M8FIR7_9GAMM|nr:ROK family protein [Thiohalocapsa marina]KAA6184567.1 ROK family protein [Thiohalocapsa marina]
MNATCTHRPHTRIGVDLGGTKIEAAALDPQGRILQRRRILTPRHNYPATLDAIAGLVQGLEQHLEHPCPVGVGTPGAISPFNGRLRNANSVWLNQRALGEDLSSLLQREVRIANDADCFALSEAIDGAAAGACTVFGVIIGTGTGGGLVIDGRLLQGPNAIAGEWGHNPLPWPQPEELPGPPCYCGKQGCIETFCSGPALSADLQRATGKVMDVPAMVTAAAHGDQDALAALQRHEHRLARALAAVINLLDPDVIVLGGGLSKLDRLYANLPALILPYVFSDGLATRIVPPRYGDASGVRGAAFLWPA